MQPWGCSAGDKSFTTEGTLDLGWPLEGKETTFLPANGPQASKLEEDDLQALLIPQDKRLSSGRIVGHPGVYITEMCDAQSRPRA